MKTAFHLPKSRSRQLRLFFLFILLDLYYHVYSISMIMLVQLYDSVHMYPAGDDFSLVFSQSYVTHVDNKVVATDSI